MGELLWIFVSAMLVNNFTLVLFLGPLPLHGRVGPGGDRAAHGAARTSSCW